MPTVEYLNYEALDDQGWDLEDDDLFDKAADAGLSEEDYGTLDVAEGEYILEAAEAQGFDWPFSCRAGACANCAGIVKEGDIDMDMQQILSDEEVEDKNVAPDPLRRGGRGQERRPDLHRVGRHRRGEGRLQRQAPGLPPGPRHLSGPTAPFFRSSVP